MDALLSNCGLHLLPPPSPGMDAPLTHYPGPPPLPSPGMDAPLTHYPGPPPLPSEFCGADAADPSIAMPPATIAMAPAELVFCGDFLTVMLAQKCGYIFALPVDPVELGIPEYFDHIKEPMDLGTVRKKLVGGLYLSVDQFCSDVNLTFDNAMEYNEEGTVVHVIAKEFKTKFETEFIHAKKGDADIVAGFGKIFRKATDGSIPEFLYDLAADDTIPCVQFLNESSKHSRGAGDNGVLMNHLGGIASQMAHFFTNVKRGDTLGLIAKDIKKRIDEFGFQVSPATNTYFPHTEELVYIFRNAEFRRNNRDGVSKLTANHNNRTRYSLQDCGFDGCNTESVKRGRCSEHLPTKCTGPDCKSKTFDHEGFLCRKCHKSR